MSQNTVTIRLTGRNAVIAILVAAVAVPGFGYYRFSRMRSALDDAKERIRWAILNENAAPALKDMTNIDYAKMSRAEIEERAERLMRDTNVAIESIEVRGALLGEPIFRVEYTVDGATPSDGKGIRYYRLNYSNLIGWTGYPRRTLSLFWYLAFFS